MTAGRRPSGTRPPPAGVVGGGATAATVVWVDERFISERHAASAARRCVDGLCDAVPAALRDTLSLVTSELVANAVLHGSLRATDSVGLRVSSSAEAIRVEVSDGGEGFQRRDRPSGDLRTGGWGLVIVEELADRWGINSGPPTTVWCEIDA